VREEPRNPPRVELGDPGSSPSRPWRELPEGRPDRPRSSSLLPPCCRAASRHRRWRSGTRRCLPWHTPPSTPAAPSATRHGVQPSAPRRRATVALRKPAPRRGDRREMANARIASPCADRSRRRSLKHLPGSGGCQRSCCRRKGAISGRCAERSTSSMPTFLATRRCARPGRTPRRRCA